MSFERRRKCIANGHAIITSVEEVQPFPQEVRERLEKIQLLFESKDRLRITGVPDEDIESYKRGFANLRQEILEILS